MSPEVREAIENARDAQVSGGQPSWQPRHKAVGFRTVADLLRRIAQDLPEGMTVGELYEDLSGGSEE